MVMTDGVSRAFSLLVSVILIQSHTDPDNLTVAVDDTFLLGATFLTNVGATVVQGTLLRLVVQVFHTVNTQTGEATFYGLQAK